MKIIVGCESSQTVAKAFRDLGHEAYSCDILPCDGEHPEWHLQGDVLSFIDQSDGCGPFWNGKQSWLNKYRNRDMKQVPAFFGSTTFLVAVTDGPHLMNFVSTQFNSLALTFAPGRRDKRFWPTVRDILIYQAAYNLPRAAVLELAFKPRIK